VTRRPQPILLGTLLLAAAFTTPTHAQPRAADEVAREQAYVDALRREDPTAAERYVTLRDARAHALADLRKVEAQYNAAGPELRGLFVRALRQAQKNYAETSLTLLDFLDARDRASIAQYHEEIARINALLEERRRTRATLEKLLGP
jgi:hypothetical protein